MRQRLLKSFRIAVSAVSLLVCGLLILLWVRSYFHPEEILGPQSSGSTVSVKSFSGILDIHMSPHTPVTLHGLPRGIPAASNRWRLEAIKSPRLVHLEPDRRWDYFNLNIPELFFCARAPYWFYLTIFATIAALPWIKWRFSLRTLLIVLTLFALFFGVIAMSMRG